MIIDMKKDVSVTFEKQNDNSFSCIVNEKFDKFGLIGYGNNAREAERDVFTSLAEIRENLGAENVPDISISLRKFDVGSFFSYYPFFNISQFAKYTGINPAQIRQYASGVRQPSQQKKELIEKSIIQVIEELHTASRAFGIG